MAIALPNRAAAPAVERGPSGIIDIGSNSIRFVVYDAPARIPAVLFNEKVMAGLGRGLATKGMLDPGAIERALTALRRFRMLANEMGVSRLRTVATAAVRDAANGGQFLSRIKALGLSPELLSGEEEAATGGFGVLSAMPDADGVVGDLGGGSLELVRVRDGGVHEMVSFPFGVLRLAALRGDSRALERTVLKGIDGAGWRARAQGQPFYLVGGSWRALARVDMHLERHPLPIVHEYRMKADAPERLARLLPRIERSQLRDEIGLSSSRIATLGDAAALLGVIARALEPSCFVVSAYGLREGLLYRALPPAVQREDPLICATRCEGARQGRFPEHGDLLNDWTAPLFAGEAPADARLRHAACLLGDIAWRAHPEFRAERGLDIGLHGNWVGVDARGRAMMARALYTSFGGTAPVEIITRLCSRDDVARADRWGLAMRLGQRLSGGAAQALKTTRLSLAPGTLRLHLPGTTAELFGEAIDRRLKTLAAAMGREVEVVLE